MSGYYTNQSDPDDDNFGGDNSGGGLRKQLEEVLAENKRLTKMLTGNRERTATDLLKDKGIDPAVLQLAPEGADPVEWVEKYSHLLGAKGTEQGETKIDEPEVEMASDDDPALVAEREALAAMEDAASTGSQATVSSDLIEKMGKIETEEELLSFFRSNGMA